MFANFQYATDKICALRKEKILLKHFQKLNKTPENSYPKPI